MGLEFDLDDRCIPGSETVNLSGALVLTSVLSDIRSLKWKKLRPRHPAMKMMSHIEYFTKFGSYFLI